MLALLPDMVWLVISILAGWCGGIARNQFSKKYAGGDGNIYLFLLICQGTALTVLLVTSTNLHVSLFTLLTALAFGVISILLGLMGNKALQSGPMSLYNVLLSSSMLIPALSGALFWSERLRLSVVLGMAGMVIMILLTTKPQHHGSKTVSGRFLLFCLVAVLSNGMIGIMQKIHQSSDYRGELDAFLVIAFAVSAALPLGLFLREKRAGAPFQVSFSPRRAPFWLAVCCGICSALPNRINLYLSGVVDSAVFFPLVNGGGLLLSVLAAILLFRERPTILQYVSIGVGFVSVLLLSGIV